MPGTLVNTLFPPQINSFMPAFVNTTDAYVYFTLSPYNESAAIQRVHISIVNQLNNENALTKASGIIMSELRYDTKSGLYCVVIPVTLIEGGQFNINQFYKVQLRFDTYDGAVPVEDKELNAYLLDNQIYFSEWSTVCLIRPILQPSIQLRTFDTQDSDRTLAFNKGIIPISGKLFFGDNNNAETETLQSFQLQILEENNDNVLMSSPVIYTGDNLDPNDINYRLDLQGLDTSNTSMFRLRINITTKNQYISSKTWPFQIAEFLEEENFDPTLDVVLDEENGIATLHVYNEETVFGTLYIKRGSSLDNFKTWEDIHVSKIAGPIDITLEDNTVSSLVWYRYSAQFENSAGALTTVYRSNIFLPKFYDAIFSRGDTQFKVSYDFKISNFKPVVNRAKLDTLGGRFPKFAENAILNYKQFSITGLISSEADAHQKFLNKREYMGDNYNHYEVYKQDFDVRNMVRNDMSDYADNQREYLTTTWNDWMWERDFREEAMKWLNDGEPKLLRTMTEGNMAVMLTDISLTPNPTLGRRLYSFSATVYEIAEAHSLNVLDSLGIYETVKLDEATSGGGGTIDPEPEYVEAVKVGQLYNHVVTDKNNIISLILQDLKERYGGVLSDKNPDNLYLKSVKIFFQSPPNVYTFDSNGMPQLMANPGERPWADEDRERAKLGYVFNVTTSVSEGQSLIFVNEKGYYQLPDILDITGLSFDRIGDIVTIEYVMIYKEKNNISTTVSGSSVDKTVVGQEQGVYMPNEYLGEQIRAKYNFVKTGEYYQRMQYWRGICVDVTPFAVLHLQYFKEDTYKDYVVGETGVLHMLKDFPVQDMCFIGRRMNKRPIERQKYLEEWEYVLDESPHSSISDIKNPIPNTVYAIGENLKIYYQGLWYDFQEQPEDTGLAAVPIEGMVNYLGNVIRSDYN